MKTHTLSWWKKKTDALFSRYIRLKYSDKDGYVSCITCGKTSHYKKMHNGHYVDRNHLSTRFEEKNCHPQCVGCNRFGNGKRDVYALFLIKTYGGRVLEDLDEQKNTKVKFSFSDYYDMIDDLTAKLVGLEIKEELCKQEEN